MLRQFGNVAPPFAQRRNLDLERDQPEEQILAEFALHHALVQVPMRRRDHAKIAPHRAVRPDRQNLAVFQHPQQLHLDRQRDVGHLVKKQRAAVGLLQQSLASLLGPGERSPGMAEQLAFGQRRAQRRHVDRHERPVAAVAVLVDRAGDKLLARAALAANMHARLGGRDDRDSLEHLLNRRRRADHSRRLLGRDRFSRR